MRKLKMFMVFLIPLMVLSADYVGGAKSYTGAIEIYNDTLGDGYGIADSIVMPLVDTVIDTTYYGVDTSVVILYPYPSVFDQNSMERLVDSADNDVWHSYDRWAMEDWAIAFYIEEESAAEAADSLFASLDYSHNNVLWTVDYSLGRFEADGGDLLTAYPLDLYDNWKLYHHTRLILSCQAADTIAVSAWLVFRKTELHENVPAGE